MGAVVLQELLGAEPERQLAGCALGCVGRMDQVLTRLEREVAPDAARGRLVGAGRAIDGPTHGDGVLAIEARARPGARR